MVSFIRSFICPVIRAVIQAVFVLGVLMTLARPGAAQEYPAKTVRLVHPFPTGAVGDTHATPAEFRNDLQQEIAMWQKVIRDNGIKA